MLVRLEKINPAYLTSNAAVGGNAGNEFYCNMQSQEGTVVRSLQFWRDFNCVRGVEIELSDDSKPKLFGSREGIESDKFYIAPGEKITSVKLWGNDYRRGRFSALELTTNQNRRLIVGYNDRDFLYEPEIGSGILVGVFGKSGVDIDSFGLGMLRRIQKSELINVEYPYLAELAITAEPKAIKSIMYDNTQGTTEYHYH